MSQAKRTSPLVAYLFAGMVGSGFILLNLMAWGKPYVDLGFDGKYGPHFQLDQRVARGWPTTFQEMSFWRWDHSAATPSFRDESATFSWPALLLNTLVGTAICLAVGWFVGRAPVRTDLPLQLSLRTALSLLAVVAILLAYYGANLREFRKQLRASNEILSTPGVPAEPDDPAGWSGTPAFVDWGWSGPVFLRSIAERNVYARAFDRVSRIEIHTDLPRERWLRHAKQLTSVKVVRFGYSIRKGQLEQLAVFPNLEAVDLMGVFVTSPEAELGEDDGPAEHISLPPLPRLRGLNLYDAAFLGDGLANLPAVEVLDLTDTEVGDDDVDVLSTLKHLRTLSVVGSKISPDGVRKLREALPECEILDRW